jgi:hypothetical protein
MDSRLHLQAADRGCEAADAISGARHGASNSRALRALCERLVEPSGGRATRDPSWLSRPTLVTRRTPIETSLFAKN